MRKVPSLAAVLALVTAMSCASDEGIRTTLDEYSIRLSERSVAAGKQSFSVSDEGAIAHQLLVLRTQYAPDDLPVGKDGIVKVDAEGIDEVGELELVAPGGREVLEVRLRPGPHVLICNIAGHYGSGMHTGLDVR